ncbi:hypothetical protein EJB05_15639, partial [Eragrostis curvula]
MHLRGNSVVSFLPPGAYDVYHSPTVKGWSELEQCARRCKGCRWLHRLPDLAGECLPVAIDIPGVDLAGGVVFNIGKNKKKQVIEIRMNSLQLKTGYWREVVEEGDSLPAALLIQ